MKTLTYRIHLAPEREGGYTVTVPALQGCVTWGRDYEHAIQMAREAIELYVGSLAHDGCRIPRNSAAVFSEFSVAAEGGMSCGPGFDRWRPNPGGDEVL